MLVFQRLYKRLNSALITPISAILCAASLAFPVAMIAVLFIIVIMAVFVEAPGISTASGFAFLAILGPLFLVSSPLLLAVILITIPKLALMPAGAVFASYGLIRMGFLLPKILLLIWIVAWVATFCAGISMGALSV